MARARVDIPWYRDEPWYRFIRWCCRVFCLIFLRVRVTGREHIPTQGAFVIVCNHQSYLDPLFCGAFIDRPLCYLARDTLFTHWFFGRAIRSVNAIPVRRDSADIGSIRRVIAKLKQGKGLCLFPEGTRTRDGRIVDFKPGFGLICRRGNAAVVPAIVDGGFECWPRHKKLFSPGHTIAVRFGPPLSAQEVQALSDKALAKHLTQVLRTMLNECRAEQGKPLYSYESPDQAQIQRQTV